MIAPTLLIGLGGIGSKIIAKVAKRVSEEVDESMQNRIAYAVFDTDINELQEIHQKNPRITPIQTSTKLTVGEYLNLDDRARNLWFPVNPILNSKTLTEGAGQVRAISRLALETAIRAGEMEPLHQTIESLYKLEQNQAEQALRIVITSSLCGGTGSGIILPIALYIRNYLTTRFRQSANIVRGFFIMPEVFYHVVRGESERNNLRCNAYATIRELDAFLMKGDGTLPEPFQNTFRLEFPRPGSNEYEEYKIRPFDFCFLFDAQNTQGRKLNDFGQYLDHAANCIFAQSIGPMNKRSNSSEDNTIRELCAERGRNRYAGAGSSSIIYPLKDVERAIALQWTQQCVSKNWLQFDQRYLEKKKAKESGGSRMGDYCTCIEDKARDEAKVKSGKSLAKHIVDQCATPSTDVLKAGTHRWNEYINALNKVGENGWGAIDNLRVEIEGCSDNMQSTDGIVDDEAVRDAMISLDGTAKKLKLGLERIKEDFAKSLFERHEGTEGLPDYALEKFFKDNNEKSLHPNAIRYFIYKAKECATEERKKKKEKLIGPKGESGKQKEIDDALENLSDLNKNKEGAWATVSGNTDKLKDKNACKEAVTSLCEQLKEYKALVLQCAILDEAVNYLERLCTSFEAFFDSLSEGIEDVEKETRIIQKKYKAVPGRTTRYVCATPELLEKMVQANPYMGDANDVSDELTRTIMGKIFDYAELLKLPDLEKRKGFFRSMFQEKIVGHFAKKLREANSSKVYMNVLDALEREVELSQNVADPEQIERGVRDIIADTRKMATPFIETPLGEQRAPINACSYNPSLNPHDDSPRSALVGKELDNHGAVADEDIPKTMILFYQSVYGLRANNLSKFAPAKQLLASNEIRGAGEYYKSYFDIVNQIVPKTEKTPVITPHIDRTWHIVNVMPDLDEQNQKRQEKRIYRAFLYAWLYKRIAYEKYFHNHTYRLQLKGAKSEEFVVSNKTPCDRYYEVLDALIINPVVVSRILEDAEARMHKELNRNCHLVFENSELKLALDKLELKEEGTKGSERGTKGKENGTNSEDDGFQYNNLSLFDFPALLKQSTPPSDFRTEVGTDMLIAMFETMLDYIKSMTSPREVPELFGKFVREQYDRFVQNSSRYARFGFRIYIDELVRAVVDWLQCDDFAENGLYDVGRDIEEDYDDKKNSIL